MKQRSNLINECVAKIDRVVLRSQAQLADFVRALPEFRTESDFARCNVNAGLFLAPYGRVRKMVNDRTKTRLFIQYYPRFQRLAALRVAIVPADTRGLQRRELETITAALSPFRFVVIEVALDFRKVRR
jgi:hypothetical protein